MPKQPYRLIPELIPNDLWGRSASQMLGRRIVWTKKIRPEAIAKADNRCQICGEKAERLICHDKWNYDGKKLIATLVCFEIHCSDCDLVTHFGRAMSYGDQNVVYEGAIVQLCKVNKCRPPTSHKILEEAIEIWMERSKKKWSVKVAPELLETYPELEGLPTYFAIALLIFSNISLEHSW